MSLFAKNKISPEAIAAVDKLARDFKGIVAVAEELKRVGNLQKVADSAESFIKAQQAEQNEVVEALKKAKQELSDLNKKAKESKSLKTKLDDVIEGLMKERDELIKANEAAMNTFSDNVDNRGKVLAEMDGKIAAAKTDLRNLQVEAKATEDKASKILSDANDIDKSIASKKAELAAIDKEIAEKKAKAKQYLGSLAAEV
jgi:chromosome segregation ATPase